ncbi:hypothetical protein GALMADRAFT_61027 [Galerina marginata CBS 339.88]|uniref:BTB domain-containing protein n=1 Tax=Galerina marginata (strain CBS 339.88) TaxID=685588 RepID=A0A067TP98_GALM3|nr:hypothetical protein GALMADRAFT_61027 [Galerina marginata CBS 339.88]
MAHQLSTQNLAGPLLPWYLKPQPAISAEQPWKNSSQRCKNSDVQVRSSDGFVFQLHRVLLEANTDAFPGSEIDTRGEIVQLTESASVLEILFVFLYPRRHPDLSDKEFQLVADVAEAVGKYEVFSAMNTCNARLKSFLPKHATEVFVHAVKHDFPELINEAIPHLARSPFLSVVTKLPPSYIVPWSRYHEAWLSVFKEAIQYIRGLIPSGGNACHGSPHAFTSPSGICTTCRCSLFTLVADLERIDSLSELDDALQSPLAKYPTLACCRPDYGYSSLSGPRMTSNHNCSHIVDLAKFCRGKINTIPPFVDFLG